jgi:hypothetical protein
MNEAQAPVLCRAAHGRHHGPGGGYEDGHRGGAKSKMNPLHGKREHQIAFLMAAVFGAVLGSFIGLRQVEPSTSLY